MEPQTILKRGESEYLPQNFRFGTEEVSIPRTTERFGSDQSNWRRYHQGENLDSDPGNRERTEKSGTTTKTTEVGKKLASKKDRPSVRQSRKKSNDGDWSSSDSEATSKSKTHHAKKWKEEKKKQRKQSPSSSSSSSSSSGSSSSSSGERSSSSSTDTSSNSSDDRVKNKKKTQRLSKKERHQVAKDISRDLPPFYPGEDAKTFGLIFLD